MALEIGMRGCHTCGVRRLCGYRLHPRSACAGEPAQKGDGHFFLFSQAFRAGLNCAAPPALGRIVDVGAGARRFGFAIAGSAQHRL